MVGRKIRFHSGVRNERKREKLVVDKVMLRGVFFWLFCKLERAWVWQNYFVKCFSRYV